MLICSLIHFKSISGGYLPSGCMFSGLIPLGTMCPLDKQIRHKISQNLYPNKLIFTFLNIPDDFMSFRDSFDAI